MKKIILIVVLIVLSFTIGFYVSSKNSGSIESKRLVLVEINKKNILSTTSIEYLIKNNLISEENASKFNSLVSKNRDNIEYNDAKALFFEMNNIYEMIYKNINKDLVFFKVNQLKKIEGINAKTKTENNAKEELIKQLNKIVEVPTEESSSLEKVYVGIKQHKLKNSILENVNTFVRNR